MRARLGGDSAPVGGARWDPERYARDGRFVAELGAPLVDLLDPRPGERVLDLGCGDGALSLKIKERGAEVVGVDSSAEQVKAARGHGLDARVDDGESLSFLTEFDAVFSNAALHWMRDPDRVVAGVWRALRPGGRFVAEMGGMGNVASVTAAIGEALERRGVDAAAVNPWHFPTAEEHRRRLAAHGFMVGDMRLLARPTPLPGPIENWLEIFAREFLDSVPEGERRELLDEVVARLRPRLLAADGLWVVDYVRLRFRAVKPGAP
ncbi:MAG: class I SAM-dependent methyltransferase [Alphaproteobacteria bacterium]